MYRVLVIFAIAAVASPVLAQPCPQPAGWAAPERHSAAVTPSFRFASKPDTSHQLQLAPHNKVKLAAAKGRKAASGAYAGLAAIDVTRRGTLDVLLSSRAYVDLVRAGKALPSQAHGHVRCQGIFKRVSFAVTPGRYALQLTESDARSIRTPFPATASST